MQRQDQIFSLLEKSEVPEIKWTKEMSLLQGN